MKKRSKKSRFNVVKFFLVLVIVYLVGFSVYKLVGMPIRHLRVLNNSYLKEQSILRETKLDDYPSFFLTRTSSIKRKLKSNPYIKDIKVEKKWFCHLYLYVDEYRALFYNRALGKVVLENNTLVDIDDFMPLPHLINYVPDNLYDEFVKQMANVEPEILLKISEIEYRPNNVDKERFLLTMNDGNYVYLTLYTFAKVNKYDEILPTLENQKGILNLDSGNYFEIIN